MATTPTQLPVPSKEPQDLKFNAGKIDEFVTSAGWTYTDRFGNKHYTIEGINYLAQQVMNAFGYVTLSGVTFTTGATIVNPNEVLFNSADSSYYKWTGSFASGAKLVPANSTPESTGGIGAGKWLNVGDSSLRSDINSTNGAGIIGSTNGKTVQENIDFLEYSYGVRLSEFLDSADPLNDGLSFARSKKLSFIIDCDHTYKTFILYDNDRVIGCGDFTLTKEGNDIPSLPKIQQPERPPGTMTDFNVDAGIIIVHSNTHSRNIYISGFNLKTTNHSDIAIFAPCIQYSSVGNIRLDGFNKVIKCKDAFMNQWSKIFALYYYSSSDTYSDNFAYDFSDGIYASGTSNTFTNVNCVNYKWPFYFAEHNYFTLTNAGGEGVNSHAVPSPTNMPRVFEFKNCTSVVMNTPFTEHLYGSFIRFSTSNSSAQNIGAGTLVINGAQATTAIYGTSVDVGAKILDITGSGSVVLNGGVITPAAAGYFLKTGMAAVDSYLEFNGTDLRFCLSDIPADNEKYTGVTSVKGQKPMHCILKGTSSISTNVVNWKSTSDDPFSMRKSSNFIRVPVGGWYEIIASVMISESHSDGSLLLSLNNKAEDSGAVIASQSIVNATTRQSVTIGTKVRLSSGDYIYVRVQNATSGATSNDYESTINVRNI